MNIEVINAWQPILALGGIGLFFGISLGFAAKKLKVKVDPKIAKVLEALPGANCGACGEAGCGVFAESVVNGESKYTGCIPGGEATAKAVAKILGVTAGASGTAMVACVQCGGSKNKAKERFTYQGLKNCKAASLVWGGNKACTYGCLGLGTCKEICPFDAIVIENGLAIILENKCTGCGKCVASCPRNIIKLIPRSQQVYLSCVSHDKLKIIKESCSVGCIACTLCVKLTPSKSLVMKDNLPQIPAKWDDYETAVKKCPAKCLTLRKESMG